MKPIFTALSFVIVFASCQKQNGDVAIDPTKKYTRTLNLSDQIVKTSVSNNTLHMDYYESANLLVDASVYHRTWALHLKEYYFKSQLSPFHFQSMSEDNTITNDWVADNLNNVSRKTVKDTSIDGKAYVKVSVNRVVNFFNTYNSAQEAVDMQNKLLQSQSDSVIFSSFYYYNGITSLTDSSSAKLTYTK